MTVATGVPNFVAAEVETSSDGSTWTDRSGFCGGVSITGGERMTGEEYVYESDYAITGVGRRQPVEVTIRCAYTDSSSELAQLAISAYESNTQFQIRWWPSGKKAGAVGYYTDADSRIINHPLPVGDANAATPAFVEIRVRTARIQSIVGT